ncbi:MAG: hypothetical protein PHX44_01675 [Sulfurimonas sp.]|nr:hypothetical protein [Sulfurimonas sp.]MDD2651727.1 hypothetical protein [Sulfurimonas sp.]MDD2651744.1 hypothetical protein [Sulfurimonas sp.]MDD3451704.1 hypothetical protein [Sulfurimonas sp.]MDD3451721.1 hypothetical protein [Sulfurimonas sp.]
MAINCEEVSAEELKRLRDIQRLLQALVLALYGTLDSLHLEEVL